MGKLKRLVQFEEDIERFRAKYRIQPTVGMRYAAQGEWVGAKKTGEVVIPIIAFIEGGMTIPMGNITMNYLKFFRLSPTLCAPNMFRVLGSIEVLNERMNLNLTHHDVNWVYNLHHLTGQGYYLKSRYPEVRLIQCLPTLNKGLKEDFLIFFGEWHDGLPCPTRRENQVGVIVVNLRILVYISLLILIISTSDQIFFHFNDSAEKCSTKPQLSLVNRESLDRIPRSEVFVNEADGQLRATHIILGYMPISFTFQTLKCVIKAKDP